MKQKLDRALDGVCVLVVALAAVLILTFDYGRDQGIYALVARSILEGHMPYRDAWDFKPPGIFLIYAFSRALFGASQWGIRLLEATGMLATAFLLVHIARAHFGKPRAGLVAAALMAFIHVQLDFWHSGQPETFGGMITVAALALGCLPWVRELSPRRTWLTAVGAGVLLGFAGLLKPPLAGGGVVLALALAYHAWSKKAGIRRAIEPIVGIFVGGIVPFVLTAIWFSAKGALGDLYDVLFVFTPHYTAIGWENQTAAGLLHWGFSEWLVRYSSLTTVGMVLLVAFRPRPAERPFVALTLGIIVVQIVGVTMQAKFFPYHYGAVWPVTALVAGLGWHEAWERLAARGAPFAAGFVVIVALLSTTQTATKNLNPFWERVGTRLSLLTGRYEGTSQEGWDKLATVADVAAGDNRAVAAFLREHTDPARPVYIWGFEPVIYDLAERSSASRYIYNVPQRVSWESTALRASLMDDLTRSPPSAVVVEHYDIFSFVTGNNLDSYGALAEFPELRDFVDARYRLAAHVGDFDVYLEP